MPQLRLRPIHADDAPFLRRVYAATRQDEIALAGWDAARTEAFLRMQFDAQHRAYRERNPHADFDLVLDGDTPLGRLYVAREADRLHVIDIALLPPFRNRGIGSALLDGLMREAQGRAAALTIHVELNNPALSLYQRLGFREISSAGFHRLMEWRADAPAVTPH